MLKTTKTLALQFLTHGILHEQSAEATTRRKPLLCFRPVFFGSARQIDIRSTRFRVTCFLRVSYNRVVRGSAWPAWNIGRGKLYPAIHSTICVQRWPRAHQTSLTSGKVSFNVYSDGSFIEAFRYGGISPVRLDPKGSQSMTGANITGWKTKRRSAVPNSKAVSPAFESDG